MRSYRDFSNLEKQWSVTVWLASSAQRDQDLHSGRLAPATSEGSSRELLKKEMEIHLARTIQPSQPCSCGELSSRGGTSSVGSDKESRDRVASPGG